MNAIAAKVLKSSGVPDVLLNNAGIGYIGKFLETPMKIWKKVIDVNLMGPVHVTQAFLPHMLNENHARKIINVASGAGFMPPPSMTPYAATKHGVVGFSECLAQELYDTNVDVMMVAPGIINTNIVQRNAFVSPNFTDKQLERLQNYYGNNGCHPSVVANDIVKATTKNILVLNTGPFASVMSFLLRISRRLARWFTVRSAPKVGYWEE